MNRVVEKGIVLRLHQEQLPERIKVGELFVLCKGYPFLTGIKDLIAG